MIFWPAACFCRPGRRRETHALSCVPCRTSSPPPSSMSTSRPATCAASTAPATIPRTNTRGTSLPPPNGKTPITAASWCCATPGATTAKSFIAALCAAPSATATRSTLTCRSMAVPPPRRTIPTSTKSGRPLPLWRCCPSRPRPAPASSFRTNLPPKPTIRNLKSRALRPRA